MERDGRDIRLFSFDSMCRRNQQARFYDIVFEGADGSPRDERAETSQNTKIRIRSDESTKFLLLRAEMVNLTLIISLLRTICV